MNKIKRVLGVVIILALLVSATPFMGTAVVADDDFPLLEGPPLPPPPEGEYVPDQIIVRFKATTLSGAEASLNENLETEVIYTSPSAGFKVLQIPKGRTVDEMVEAYSENPLVEYAEPNYIHHVFWSPNDLIYSYQWHFDQINLEAAWDLDTTVPTHGGDPGIVVAIVDTGVAYETYGGYVKAPDLANTNFTSGWDFVNDDAHPNDDNSHGTHVCGTIAQSTNNSLGVAGIAFNTTIMPVKTFNSAGTGTDAWIADGFYYATDNGADIINYSAGGPHSTTLENAVIYAYNAGVTIICAAGNDYETGNDPQYPAAYDEYCIAVGATRYDQTRAPYSNTGSYLDIVAPGGDLTVDQNYDGYGDGVLQNTFAPGDPTDFGYWFFEGTSMACPHVAGVAALMLAADPSWTPDQVRQALESTATDRGTPGRDDYYGWGLLNAPAAFTPPPPSAPVLTSPSYGATVPTLTPRLEWNASAGATEYGLQVATNSSFTSLVVDQTGITDLYYDIPGGLLSWNTRYYWRANASNSFGSTSSWSGSRYFQTAVGPPNAPNPISPGTAITFTWSAPSGATKYYLQVNTDPSFTGTSLFDGELGNVTSKEVIGLTMGTTYYWRVKAGSTGGWSDWSSVRSVIASEVP